MAKNKVNNGYIIISIPGEADTTIEFQSTQDELASSKAANLSATTILGRSEPIQVYGSSGPRSWNIDLKFFAEETDQEQDQVVRWVDLCESLVYPIYKQGISFGLPKLHFIYGNLLNFLCVCSNVNTTWHVPWNNPDVSTLGLPMYAEVQLTLEQISTSPPGHHEVRRGEHRSRG